MNEFVTRRAVKAARDVMYSESYCLPFHCSRGIEQAWQIEVSVTADTTDAELEEQLRPDTNPFTVPDEQVREEIEHWKGVRDTAKAVRHHADVYLSGWVDPDLALMAAGFIEEEEKRQFGAAPLADAIRAAVKEGSS